jgi:hypothetical protein
LCRNCLPKHVTEGKIEEMERQGIRCKQLLLTLRKKKILKLREEALDHTVWRTHFGIGYGPLKTDYCLSLSFST